MWPGVMTVMVTWRCGLLAGAVDEFGGPVPLADAVGQVGDGQGGGWQ